MTSGHVRQHLQHAERKAGGHAPIAKVSVIVLAVLDAGPEDLRQFGDDAAHDFRAKDDAESLGIDGFRRELRFFSRQRRGGQRQLRIARKHLQRLPRLDVFQRIEVGDDAGRFHRRRRSVELRNRANARPSGVERSQNRLAADADRRDRSQTGDDDAGL